MKKYIFASFIFSFGLAAVFLASASISDIQYPVEELGNCANEAACKAYCDNSSNTEACLNFAEKHNLMPAEEIEKARNFSRIGFGPGGCITKDSCESYCDSIEHMDECISFAEENNLLPPQELEQAKKVQAAKNRGVKMPACGNKKSCDVYCSQPAHMEECITFGREAGFIPEEELAEAEKVLAAIKAGAVPPPCAGKKECDIYCSQEEHFDVCLDFALAAGFMSLEEAEMARKTKGKGPGGCRGKEECDAFCQQEGNMEICAQFAYEYGMMSKEEFEMFKKTGGKGPGECKSKEECESFCDNPENQEVCFNFAKEHGMISDEEIQRMEKDKEEFRKVIQDIPQEVYLCLESILGSETAAKLKSGEFMPSEEIGEQMRVCFEQNVKPMEPGGPGEAGEMMPGGMAPSMTGPGGCASPEECKKYCETNPEECKDFEMILPTEMQKEEFAPGAEPGMEEMKSMEMQKQKEMMEFQPIKEGMDLMDKPPQEFAPGTEPSMEEMKSMEMLEPEIKQELQEDKEPTSSLDSLLGLVLYPLELLLR